jgi:hypothetical protein
MKHRRLLASLLIGGPAGLGAVTACGAGEPALVDTTGFDATVPTSGAAAARPPSPASGASSSRTQAMTDAGRRDASLPTSADAEGPPLDADADAEGPSSDADDGAAPEASWLEPDEAGCVERPAPPPSASVLGFHKNPSRDGLYVDPAMTVAGVSAMRPRIAVPLQGQVYAQPLYVGHGPQGHELFIVATESNHVTAIDGCGRELWDHSYGAPAPYADLPCGNISPTLGITGTPVIDEAARTLYFDAMTQLGSGPAGLRHFVHAVSIDDGSELDGWPVDLTALVPGFDSALQNQRGALALVGGTLYVPFGGHLGDCGSYRGWVVGVRVANPSSVQAWSTAVGSTWDAGVAASGGGFWAPGGVTSDGTSLFLVSGNTKGTSDAQYFSAPASWVGGDAVLRIQAGPSFSGQTSDFFYPANWASLDSTDSDLGGMNAVPVDVGGSHYLVTASKRGDVYVLDRDQLGGMDGAVWSGELPCTPNCGVVGVPVAYPTDGGVHVWVPDRDYGFYGLTIMADGGGTFGGAGGAYGAPMVTTDGYSTLLIWTSMFESMYARDPGNQIGMSWTFPDSTHPFAPPIVANGRVVLALCGTCFGPDSEFGPTNGMLVFVY